jgi:hypothetical protein
VKIVAKGFGFTPKANSENSETKAICAKGFGFTPKAIVLEFP